MTRDPDQVPERRTERPRSARSKTLGHLGSPVRGRSPAPDPPGQTKGEQPRRRLALGRQEIPRVGIAIDRQRMLAAAVFVLLALALLYVVIPQLPGVQHTWDRLDNGNAWWIGVALALELVSMASYVVIFRGVHVPPDSPITYRDAYKITMASLAATRLFAAGGAGGMILTAWSLHRSGMARREVATRMVGFVVLLYGVYVAAMILCGVGLYLGLFSGAHPFAITIGPAIVGTVAIALFVALAFLPARWEQRIYRAAGTVSRRRETANEPRGASLGTRLSKIDRPALQRLRRRSAAGAVSLVAGVRFAVAKVRHPDWAMIGAISWWALNIAVLYASFRAFGAAPPGAVVVQAYFVGMLANLLPVPGGIGVVDGGMIGASVALGVPFHQALPAVLTYRLFAFWLPSIPGAVAYFQLRRTVHRWERAAQPWPGQRASKATFPSASYRGKPQLYYKK